MMRWLLIFFIFCFKFFEVNARDNAKQLNRILDLSLHEEVLDHELCEQQLRSIGENPLLIVQFLDSGIRLPRSLLMGNFFDIGNYYQCLDINQELSDTIIEGKYCMLNIPLNQNTDLINLLSNFDKGLNTLENKEILRAAQESERLRKTVNALTGEERNYDKSESLESVPFQLALSVAGCIPKPCTTHHAAEILFPFNVTALGIQFQEEFCRLPNDKQWVPGDYIAIIIFSILGLFTLLSTGYDAYYSTILKKDSKTTSTIYKSFSVYSNYRRLMTFTSNSETLNCLDGIRTISLAWIIAGHCFSVAASESRVINKIDIQKLMDSFSSAWIVSAPISVDTFFMLSGFLVVYTTAGKLSSKKLLKNVHFYYLNRILRMFPILATATILQATLWNHMFDGPILRRIIGNTMNCRKYWWTNFLYIQNFVNPEELCLSHTWYLAIDMQLHILSPLVLYWVLYNKRTAWLSMTGALSAIIIAATIYCFVNDFPGTQAAVARLEDISTYIVKYYYNTLTRASPFLVGMCFGYLVHTYRGEKLKISKVILVLAWATAIGIATCVVVFHHYATLMDWNNQLIINVMNSFMRPAWAGFIGWVIFACVLGYGGPVNRFLSLDIWRLPARISYAMYIFHYPLQFIAHITATVPYYFSMQTNMFRFLSEYSLAFVVGFLVTLLIDAPFSTLFKVVLGGGIKKQKEILKDNGPQTEDNKDNDIVEDNATISQNNAR